MSENDFHARADATQEALLEALESADADGAVEVDLLDGIVSITLPDGRQWLVSKHAPSEQLWLSSPISGGLHFSFDAASKRWQLADGRGLTALLAAELHAQAGVTL